MLVFFENSNYKYHFICFANHFSFIYSCVVVEDSTIGLAAAKAAGMTCIVTKRGYKFSFFIIGNTLTLAFDSLQLFVSVYCSF
jgi:hypothetical protein